MAEPCFVKSRLTGLVMKLQAEPYTNDNTELYVITEAEAEQTWADLRSAAAQEDRAKELEKLKLAAAEEAASLRKTAEVDNSDLSKGVDDGQRNNSGGDSSKRAK
jgi:hypothetical protein